MKAVTSLLFNIEKSWVVFFFQDDFMSPNMLPNNKKITIANTNLILYMLDIVLKTALI